MPAKRPSDSPVTCKWKIPLEDYFLLPTRGFPLPCDVSVRVYRPFLKRLLIFCFGGRRWKTFRRTMPSDDTFSVTRRRYRQAASHSVPRVFCAEHAHFLSTSCPFLQVAGHIASDTSGAHTQGEQRRIVRRHGGHHSAPFADADAGAGRAWSAGCFLGADFASLGQKRRGGAGQ